MAKKKATNPKLSAAAKTLGKQGGLKGGVKRAQVLTAEERREIASEGGKAHAAKEGVRGNKELSAKEKSKEKGKKEEDQK